MLNHNEHRRLSNHGFGHWLARLPAGEIEEIKQFYERERYAYHTYKGDRDRARFRVEWIEDELKHRAALAAALAANPLPSFTLAII